jgi:hypothetical protein
MVISVIKCHVRQYQFDLRGIVIASLEERLSTLKLFAVDLRHDARSILVSNDRRPCCFKH